MGLDKPPSFNHSDSSGSTGARGEQIQTQQSDSSFLPIKADSSFLSSAFGSLAANKQQQRGSALGSDHSSHGTPLGGNTFEDDQSWNADGQPGHSISEGSGHGGINVSWPLLIFVVVVSVLIGLVSVANQRSAQILGTLVGINEPITGPEGFTTLNYFADYWIKYDDEYVIPAPGRKVLITKEFDASNAEWYQFLHIAGADWKDHAEDWFEERRGAVFVKSSAAAPLDDPMYLNRPVWNPVEVGVEVVTIEEIELNEVGSIQLGPDECHKAEGEIDIMAKIIGVDANGELELEIVESDPDRAAREIEEDALDSDEDDTEAVEEIESVAPPIDWEQLYLVNITDEAGKLSTCSGLNFKEMDVTDMEQTYAVLSSPPQGSFGTTYIFHDFNKITSSDKIIPIKILKSF